MARTRDHGPLTYVDFRGDYNRSPTGASPEPLRYFNFSSNIMFWDKEFGTRYGVSSLLALPGGVGTLFRFAVYQRSDEASPRFIVLGTSGNFYDTGSATPSTAILTVSAATDFTMVVVANRCYICPFTYSLNEAVPISGEKVYVYDGTGAARAAAGAAPSGGTMAAATGAAGQVEAGRYVIAVAFETASGFITGWGPATFVQYTAPGGFVISLSNINLGPAGTVARWIGITRPIYAWDGNQRNYELFKFKRIADNTTTVATLNFFVAQLEDSGDYLHNQLATIPSGVSIGLYEGRLTIAGESGNESIIRLSKTADYESVSSTDGFVLMYPGDGGGLKNSIDYGGVLFGFKSQRCYAVQSNGQEPSTWVQPVRVDGGLGAEPHSIAMSMDSRSPHKDVVLVGNVNGLYAFTGRFQPEPLSKNISQVWVLATKSAVPKMEIVFAPNGPLFNMAFIAMSWGGITATEPQLIILMDFSDGLSPDTVKWSSGGWTFKIGAEANMFPRIRSTKDGLVIGFKSITPGQRLFKIDTAVIGIDVFSPGVNSAMNSSISTGFLPQDSPYPQKYHFGAMTVTFGRALAGNSLFPIGGGGGTIASFFMNERDFPNETAGPVYSIPDQYNPVFSLMNLTGEGFALRLSSVTVGHRFLIRGITIHSKLDDAESPA